LKHYKSSYVIGLFLTAALAAGVLVTKKVMSQATDRQPYYLVYTERSLSFKSPTSSLEKHLYRAVKADGSTASGSTDATSFQIRTITLHPQRLQASLSDHLKKKSTFYAGADVLVRPPSTPSQCATNWTERAKATYLGEQQIAGMLTYHYRATGPSPMSKEEHMTDEQWFASTLNCDTIQRVTERLDALGNVVAHFELVPVSAEIGNPADDLFSIPADYIEVLPSELLTENTNEQIRSAEGDAAAKRHVPPATATQGYKGLDQRYSDSLKNKKN
jgi:hypothetical protein